MLRYWETEFEELRPRKNRAGRRIYTADDITVVKHIQHLLRVDKYTIEGARQVMNQSSGVSLTTGDQRRELIELRGFLENLLHQLR